METVGVYKAKTHLTNLLQRVAKGEVVIITKHGRPVAKLLPVSPTLEPESVIQELRALRRGVTLGDSVHALIEEGRA